VGAVISPTKEDNVRGYFFRGVVLGAVTSTLVLGATAALAGTGVGGVFNLGKSNTVNKSSSLAGSSSGSQLTVSNSSTSSGSRGLTVNGSSGTTALLAHNSNGSAATFQTPANVAPIAVSSSVQVPSLNASLLGGHGAGFFLPATGQAADAAELGSQPPSHYLTDGVSATSSTSVPLKTAQTLAPVLTLPTVSTTGEYYINASVMLIVGSGDTVTCIYAVNGGGVGPFATVGPVSNQTYETLPLTYSGALAAGDHISVECSDYTSNANTSFYDGGGTALLIHSDNGSAPSSSKARKLRTFPAVVR
jgi:hypothetical protein